VQDSKGNRLNGFLFQSGSLVTWLKPGVNNIQAAVGFMIWLKR